MSPIKEGSIVDESVQREILDQLQKLNQATTETLVERIRQNRTERLSRKKKEQQQAYLNEITGRYTNPAPPSPPVSPVLDSLKQWVDRLTGHKK
jgi:hypothetical protein